MTTRESTTTLICLSGAVVLGGLLAGVDVVRLLVEMPAWHRVGVTAWADFSRHADLGKGFFLFPTLGIGSALLSLAAALTHRSSGRATPATGLLLYAGAALAIAGMITTAFAAPHMLSLRQAGNDVAAIQRAFDGFERWGGIRSVFQTLAFLANVGALVAVASRSDAPSHGAAQ
jgi:hypothetical protein